MIDESLPDDRHNPPVLSASFKHDMVQWKSQDRAVLDAWEKAEPDLEKAASINPSDSEMAYLQCHVYCCAGHFEKVQTLPKDISLCNFHAILTQRGFVQKSFGFIVFITHSLHYVSDLSSAAFLPHWFTKRAMSYLDKPFALCSSSRQSLWNPKKWAGPLSTQFLAGRGSHWQDIKGKRWQ